MHTMCVRPKSIVLPWLPGNRGREALVGYRGREALVGYVYNVLRDLSDATFKRCRFK